jgi:hypothetical protein
MVTSGQKIDGLYKERQSENMALRETIIAEQVLLFFFAYLQTLR